MLQKRISSCFHSNLELSGGGRINVWHRESPRAPGDSCTSEHPFSFGSLNRARPPPSILLLHSSRLRHVRIGIHQLIKSMLEMTPTSLALLPAQPDTLTSSFTRSLKHKHTCKHGNSLDHYGLRLGLPQAQLVCSNRRANTSLSVWEPREGGREGGEKPWLRIIRESFSLLQMSLNCLHPCKNKALFLPHLMFPEDCASQPFLSRIAPQLHQ